MEDSKFFKIKIKFKIPKAGDLKSQFQITSTDGATIEKEIREEMSSAIVEMLFKYKEIGIEPKSVIINCRKYE